MLKISLMILIGIGIVATAAFFLVRGPSESTSIESDDERGIRTLVEGFGKQLQSVDLLQEDGLAEMIKEQYGPYLASGLLNEWMNEPRNALGRQAGSHWPGRIEITKIGGGDKSRAVRGELIEATNEGGGVEDTLRRPILIIVREEKDEWRISSITVGPYPGDGEWVLSPVSPQGTQYMYPDPLPTQFIAAREWPPMVEMTAGEFTCAEESVAATAETMTARETVRHAIDDRIYCRTITASEAGRSIDRRYEYVTAQGDFLARVVFTLRFPECRNYDASRRDACLLERDSFDINAFADRIAQSIRMQ